MAQNLNAQTDGKLIDISGLIGTAGVAKGKFPFNEALLSAISSGSSALESADADLAAKETAYRTAVEARRGARAALLASLSSAAKLAEADDAVTDTMLRQIGLQPRAPRSTRPRTPLVPTGLVVEGYADGRLRASWKDGGNGPKMAYALETSADGVSWSYLPSVTRRSVVLEGYAPGVAAWFRVRAANAGMLSAPTTAVSVYAPTAPVVGHLRLAA